MAKRPMPDSLQSAVGGLSLLVMAKLPMSDSLQSTAGVLQIKIINFKPSVSSSHIHRIHIRSHHSSTLHLFSYIK
jgi:hypothetical protein